MAVKGLDIFKLSPKKNCKECGVPTCMAFCMKVAQGALPIEKCPYMSDEAIALLSEATAPPMKTIGGDSDSSRKPGLRCERWCFRCCNAVKGSFAALRMTGRRFVVILSEAKDLYVGWQTTSCRSLNFP